jgi:2-oxoisovalerate dehydrogenase E2 component (dihydrolipoyl transacylase)
VLALGGKVGDVMGVGTELIRLEVEGAGNVAAGAPPVTARAARTGAARDRCACAWAAR